MRREAGASLVEVALTLPILLMLVMGVVDFGRAFAARIAIQDASQEGALVAGFAPAETARIVNQTVEAGASVPVTSSDVTNTCEFSPDRVTVTVVHDLTLITPFVQGLVGGSIQLTTSETATDFNVDQTCAVYP